MENATIHCMSSNRCPVSTTPTEKLGEYRVTGYPIRSHHDYARVYGQSDAAGLNAHGIKNVNNALWSIPGLYPPDLVRADILHNLLLRMLDQLMSWIQGFLEQHYRINAFNYVWHRVPQYLGFSVPGKAYRMISQWSGKEICNFAKITLGTFTAALRRSADQPWPTRGQLQDFNKAIRCVRNISHFYLMTQYTSHTDQTVSYMRKYLQGFHETKDVFLHFRAVQKTKTAAAAAHKSLLNKQTQESVQGLTVSEKAKACPNNTLQRRDLVDEILSEGAYYNFPKIHLISHFAEQIPKFGSLPQYSTDITEYMHKAFKDAYRRSNKVD